MLKRQVEVGRHTGGGGDRLDEAGPGLRRLQVTHPDPHDAGHYLGGFDAGGLGLPDRDYYTKTDPSSDSLRTFYVDHIVKVLALAGEDATRAKSDARKILALVALVIFILCFTPAPISELIKR